MKTLFAHPNFSSLSETLVRNNQDTMQHGQADMGNFADDWPGIIIHDVKETVEHKDVTYIADFSEPKNFFSNYAMIRSLVDYYADKVRVIVPYFPVGTMERISKK